MKAIIATALISALALPAFAAPEKDGDKKKKGKKDGDAETKDK